MERLENSKNILYILCIDIDQGKNNTYHDLGGKLYSIYDCF
jgi:hypothetical protein